MASQTLYDVEDRFPVGTTVSVYARPPAGAWNGSSTPPGSVVTTGVVGSDGTVTFSGLTETAFYLAYAGGRSVNFRADPSLPSSGSSVADADASTKGKVQLAGDLAGAAAAPIVPAIANSKAASAYGVSPSNTAAANSTALQALFDAAKAAKADVVFNWTGEVQYNAAPTITRRGQTVRGTSAWYTILRQMANGQHGIVIGDDTDTGGTIATANQHVIFKDFRLLGPGAGVSTANGIHGPSDGDWFKTENVTVAGFAKGVFLDGWAQVLFDNTVLAYNGINCHTAKIDSAANTISWINSGCARASTIGWLHEGGGGCTINGGDWVEQPLGIQVGDAVGLAATLTLNGGNFEAIQDAVSALPRFIQVNSGSVLVVNGTQFQKVDGVDGDAIAVNGGSVHVTKATLTGMAAGKVLVRKNASTDVVTVNNPTANLSTTADAIADPGTSYPFGFFPQRADNAVPAATAAYRGLLLHKMVRDSVSDVDALVAYIRDRKSGANVYSRRTLTQVITGTGAPEGSVQAAIGTIYMREDGSSGSTLYVKEAGTGTTGWAAYGQRGPAGAPGSRRDIALQAAGFVAENFNIEFGQAVSPPTAGTVYGYQLGFFAGDLITYLCVGVGTAGVGTTPTLIRLGLIDSTGKVIAVTADEKANAAWTTTGIARIPLTAPLTIPADGGYELLFLQVGAWGTTQMALVRPGSILSPQALSSPIGTGMRRLATHGASQTDLPAVNANVPTSGLNNLNYWAAAA